MAKKDLSSSLEDYLEAIYLLSRSESCAHANAIAEFLGVGKSSVSWALKQLAQKELINYAPYEAITLTDAGRDQAARMAQRHADIKAFLTDVLGIDDETAEHNACRMEHVVDKDVMARMREFLTRSTAPSDTPDTGVDHPQHHGRDQHTIERLKEVLHECGREFATTEEQITRSFLAEEGHYTVQRLREQVGRQFGEVSEEQVTGTLELLCQMRIARMVRLQDQVIYEHFHAGAHHDHLFCVQCGAIVEFYDPRIEQLQQTNARRADFRLLVHALNLYGLCGNCIAKQAHARRLSECAARERLRIIDMVGNDEELKRIRELGLRKGAVVEVLNPSCSGDNVIVMADETRLMLDADTAEKIKVVVEEQEPDRGRRAFSKAAEFVGGWWRGGRRRRRRGFRG